MAAPCPRVSVIIPHLNTPHLLARCITSVLTQKLDHGTADIIVVDNGTPRDDLAPLISVAGSAVQFLYEPIPGPGPARNRGIAAARAEVVALIDADRWAEPGWLQAAVVAVERGGWHAIAGGPIEIGFADPGKPTPVEVFEAVFGFRQQMYIEKLHFSVTANLAMTRQAHAAVGPFGGLDVAEDKEWGLRAHALGFTVQFVPGMRLSHPARADYPALERKWSRLIHQEFGRLAAAGAADWRWQLRAVAVAASALPHAAAMLASRRVAARHNRLAGVGVLVRIRAFRCAEMLRLAWARGGRPDYVWNQPGAAPAKLDHGFQG